MLAASLPAAAPARADAPSAGSVDPAPSVAADPSTPIPGRDTPDAASSAAGTGKGLLGDPWGARSGLGTVGITLGLLEQSEVIGNVTGGIHTGVIYEGVTSLGFGLDTQTAFGWPGGTFNVTAYQYRGRGLTEYNLPSLTAVSGVEQTARGARLFELWYEQTALDNKVAIRVGQMSVDQEFMITQYGGVFINAGYGFPTLASSDLPSGGIDYPLATPGIRLKVAPDEQWTGLLGIFNGDPAGRGPGDPQKRDGGGTSFRLNDGTFAIAELQYGRNQGKDATGLPGLFKIGAWYQTQNFADQRISASGLSLANPANAAAGRTRWGNYSPYATVDQLLWRKPDTPDGGVAFFARAMAAPPDRNLVDAFVQAGLTDKAPLSGRDGDTVGIAVSWAHIGYGAAKLASDQAFYAQRPATARHAETTVEATYQAQATDWLQVQGDLQYVLNPGGGILNPLTTRRVSDALVLAIRTAITF